jgi:hypothetical protein
MPHEPCEEHGRRLDSVEHTMTELSRSVAGIVTVEQLRKEAKDKPNEYRRAFWWLMGTVTTVIMLWLGVLTNANAKQTELNLNRERRLSAMESEQASIASQLILLRQDLNNGLINMTERLDTLIQEGRKP